MALTVTSMSLLARGSHHGHHARFMRMVAFSNSTMLRVMSSQTARGSARMGVALLRYRLKIDQDTLPESGCQPWSGSVQCVSQSLFH